MSEEATSLDLRELFAEPWEGEGTLWRPWWLRLLPVSSSFRFRSEILNETDDSWDVLDTTVFADGSKQRREMHCQRLPNGRLRLTADDMPGGAEVRPGPDRFDFSPYVIRTPVRRGLTLPIRHLDSVQVTPDGTMIDTMELRLFGIRVGRVRIVLHRAQYRRTSEREEGP